MRAEEDIPASNYIDRIKAILALEDEQTSDGVDIHALTRRNGTTDPSLHINNMTGRLLYEQEVLDGPISHNSTQVLRHALQSPMGTADQVVQLHNHAYSFLDQEHLSTHIRPEINHYERLVVATDLSRRGMRRTPTAVDEIPEELEDFIHEWLDLAVDVDSKPVPELTVPGGMQPFAEIFRLYMPARLDANSWVATELLKIHGAVDQEPGLPDGTFRRFDPSMLDNGGTRTVELPNGTVQRRQAYFGIAKHGRILFWPHHGVELPFTIESSKLYDKISERKQALEDALISLSRRIASYLVVMLMVEYVIPMAEDEGSAVLGREEVEQAVREILGPAWFDLPFDHQYRLKWWSVDDVLKPDGQCVGWDVFLGGSDDTVEFVERADIDEPAEPEELAESDERVDSDERDDSDERADIDEPAESKGRAGSEGHADFEEQADSDEHAQGSHEEAEGISK